jgi:alpha-L-arabinofuranosidase
MTTNRRTFLTSASAALFTALTARKGFGENVTTDRKIELLPDEAIATIRPELHSHFAEHLGSCVYGGLWVGPASPIPNINGYRKAAVEYLRALGVPVLRWPGGCFADDYHWRDGIGPASQRPKTVNMHWGQYTEDNSFGTHEFVGLCRLIGAEPYFAGNVGSGAPAELRNWMEYCNYPSGSTLSDERARNGSPQPFNVKYWGVGNEAWGCGGNMTGDEYATDFRNFATYLPKIGDAPQPFLIACGPSKDNTEWTQDFFTGMHLKRRLPDGYAMHFYSNSKVPCDEIHVVDMTTQFATLPQLEAAIIHQRSLMDPFDTQKKIGLMVDEWGVWDRMVPEEEKAHGRLWQQITMRAGVATAMGLNVFHRQADKLVMCNIAQMVNVLDSMLLTSGDKCVRTPSYYAFELAKPMRGKTAIKTDVAAETGSDLSISTAVGGGNLVVMLVNPKHDEAVNLTCSAKGHAIHSPKARSLFHSDMNACNSFEAPDTLTPRDISVALDAGRLVLRLPALSVTTVEAKLA